MRDERRDDNLPDDWRQILHEEIARLSDRYRLPLLLCDLEGKTHARAASELGCGEATLQRRLNSARGLLRSRLSRRGSRFRPGRSPRPSAARLPRRFPRRGSRRSSGRRRRSRRTRVGLQSATSCRRRSQTWPRKSLQTMLLGQIKAAAFAALFLIALLGVAWKVGIAGQEKPGPREAPGMQGPRVTSVASPARAQTIEPAGPNEVVVYQGRVLDPDGKPFAGAAVYLVSYGLKHPNNPPVRATSGADGRFRFAVPKSDFDTSLEEHPWSYAPLLARTPGLAFGVASADVSSRELTLRLARDDVPISGRIIDLQGRPVAAATVRVVSVRAPAAGRLDEYLKALRERNEVANLGRLLPARIDAQPEPPVISPVRTDADGRFQIAGIGRERMTTLQIEGPAIETQRVMVRTRPGATLRIPAHAALSTKGYRPELVTIYGATFVHVAGPTRPIEGVVRDVDSGRPLAGIMVRGEHRLESDSGVYVHAVTDAQGHYRLIGLPQGQEGHVLAVPPCDFPYYGRRKASSWSRRTRPCRISARVPVGQSQGSEPVHLDITLKRGVWVTGRLIDRQTQKPVRGQVEYFVFLDNPQYQGYPGFRSSRIGPYFVGSDGAFHFAAFPGPGLIAARADESRYVRAAGMERFKSRGETKFLRTSPSIVVPDNFNVLEPIDPAPGTESLARDLYLESGRSLPVTVLGPDGTPSTDLFVTGLKEMTWWEKVPPGTSDLKISSLTPGRARTVGFRHEAKRLAGELVLRGDETRRRR